MLTNHINFIGAVRSGGGVKVTVEPVKGGAPQEVACDVLLVCIGRRPYTAKLGLEVRGGGVAWREA